MKAFAFQLGTFRQILPAERVEDARTIADLTGGVLLGEVREENVCKHCCGELVCMQCDDFEWIDEGN